MSDEEWVNVAMTDDLLVADLLLRLNYPHPPPPPAKKLALALSVYWTVRQPRTKPGTRHLEAKSKAESTRASPTTPLSWSGATSVSGGAADVLEECRWLTKPSDGARSKVNVVKLEPKTTTTKRPRTKKTLAELKEQDSLLLKERRSLKNELANLLLSVEKERASNGSLKRKLEVQLQETIKKPSTTATSSEKATYEQSDQLQKIETVCDNIPIMTANVCCSNLDSLHQQCSSKLSCKPEKMESLNGDFMLPDLNKPLEEDSGSEILYVMS